MSGGLTYTIDPDQITLIGDLVLGNMNHELIYACKKSTNQHHLIKICCANIQKIDCAGLSWIITSIKTCHTLKKKCHIVNFPVNILQLITLYLTKEQQSLFYDAQP